MRTKSSANKPANSKAIARGRDSRAPKRKLGEGSSKSIPADIMEPKTWDLEFMGKVEPVFVDMVEIQKWGSFLTHEEEIYPELVHSSTTHSAAQKRAGLSTSMIPSIISS